MSEADDIDETIDEPDNDAREPPVMFTLWRDVAVLLRLAKTAPAGHRAPLRRAFLRAGMSLVEASISHWKDLILEEHKGDVFNNQHREPALSEAEVACLVGRKFDVDERGLVRDRRLDVDLISDLKFTIRCLAKIRQIVPYEEVVKLLDFNAFRTAREARNRLTHPKRRDTLEVSDEEIASVKRALDSLHAATTELAIIEWAYGDGRKSTDPIDWDGLEGDAPLADDAS